MAYVGLLLNPQGIEGVEMTNEYKGFCGYENCLNEPVGVLQMADGEIPVCEIHATAK